MSKTWKLRFLIGGFPRAGTTLLRTLLDCHSNLIVPAETSFFLRSIDFRLANEARLLRSVERLHRALPYLLVSDIRKSLENGRTQIAVFDQLMSLAADHLGYKKVNGWGEKSPRNIEKFKDVKNKYPEVRFLLVIRNGKDVVTSRVKNRPDYHCSIDRFINTAEIITTLPTGFAKVIRYESLVKDPVKVLREVQSYLGLSTEDLLAQSAKESPNRQSHLENQPNVANGISKAYLGKWQKFEHKSRILEFEKNAKARSLNALLGYPD